MAEIQSQKCPKCRKLREIGLYGDWRRPATLQRVRCLFCRISAPLGLAIDKHSSKEDKTKFRAKLEEWLNTRMSENRLTGDEKQRVLVYADGLKKMTDQPGRRPRVKGSKYESTSPVPDAEDSTAGEHMGLQSTLGEENGKAPNLLANDSFLKKAEAKFKAIEADLGSIGPLEEEDLNFDTTIPPALAATHSMASASVTKQFPTSGPSNFIPFVPRDEDSCVELMGAVNQKCIVLEKIYRAYIKGQQHLEELVRSKPSLYQPLLCSILDQANMTTERQQLDEWAEAEKPYSPKDGGEGERQLR